MHQGTNSLVETVNVILNISRYCHSGNFHYTGNNTVWHPVRNLDIAVKTKHQRPHFLSISTGARAKLCLPASLSFRLRLDVDIEASELESALLASNTSCLDVTGIGNWNREAIPLAFT
jgi:hypothetical protein